MAGVGGLLYWEACLCDASHPPPHMRTQPSIHPPIATTTHPPYTISVVLQLCLWLSAGSWPPICGNGLLFWLREASLAMVLWIAMHSIAIPLPLQLAAKVLASQVAAVLASSGWRMQLSQQLCATALARYSRLLRNIAILWAAVLPTSLITQAMEWRPSGDLAHVLLTLIAHLACAWWVLRWLHQREWRQRAAFASAHGLGTELAALQLRRQQQSWW